MKINSLKTLLTTLFLALALFGCGSKPVSKTDFSYSLSGIVNGTPMAGGIYLWAQKVDETGAVTETFIVDLSADDSADIPFGTWDIYIVAYEGPTLWSGNNYCGDVTSILLDTDEKSLQMDLSQSNCSTLPIFNEMLAAKAATIGPTIALWDSAQWDSSNWGP